MDTFFSFDIFDTLITRKTATPDGIFAFMQDEIKQNKRYQHLPSYVQENFYTLRREAESYAKNIYNTPENQEITFDQIYDIIAFNNGLTEEQKKQIQCLEIETEQNNLFPIEENIQKIKTLISKGCRVVCISDMYLQESVIRSFLSRLDNVFLEIPIYVSVDFKKGKKSGELFHLVKEKENIDFSDWTHTGDNLKADIEAAQKLGIKADYYPFPKLEKHEVDLLTFKSNDSFVQITIGTARMCRIQTKGNSKQNFGVSYIAPMLFPYVRWLLDESIKKGYKWLYFIARDGYLLKKISDILIKEQNLDIQTKYIYGSRRVFQVYAENKTGLECMLHKNAYHSDLNRIMERLMLSKEELFSFLPPELHDLNYKIDTAAKQQRVWRILLENEKFTFFLQERDKAKKNNLIEYLKQEINFSDEHFAFVEYRGGGQTQDCLMSVIKEFYKNPIATFFLSISSDPNNSFAPKYQMFLSNYDNILLEVLARAPHGQTCGYSKDEKGCWHPVLDSVENKQFDMYCYDEITKGCELFSEKYAQVVYSFQLPNLLDCYLSYFEYVNRGHLDENLAALIGDIPFSSDRSDTGCVFAPPLTEAERSELLTQKTLNVRDLIRLKRYI